MMGLPASRAAVTRQGPRAAGGGRAPLPAGSSAPAATPAACLGKPAPVLHTLPISVCPAALSYSSCVAAGVDVVCGHSSHHVKGAEVHAGKLAIYGCGDLVSDYEGIAVGWG